MGKRQKLEIGGLNIKVHPHEDGAYGDLIDLAYKIRKIAKVYGDRYGLITMLDRSDGEGDMAYGVMSTFLELEMGGEWFNTSTMDEASENDIRQIVIPENLRPNLKTFRFAFNLKRHELIFEHYSEGDRLTHASALNFFRNVFTDKRIQKKFGNVMVSTIMDRGGIEQIFSIPRITELNIYIEKPNSDLWGDDFEEHFEEHLEDKGARSMDLSYRAEPGMGITRDEDLDRLIRASLNNGRASAKGYGPEGHMKVSTEKFPRVVQEKYEDSIAPSVVFRRLASRFRR
jgi:Domain of unknown function (DUF4747)